MQIPWQRRVRSFELRPSFPRWLGPTWLNVGTGSSRPYTTTYLVGDEHFSLAASWQVRHLSLEDQVIVHVERPVDPWTAEASWVASAKEQQHGTVGPKYAEPPFHERPVYWHLGLGSLPWDDHAIDCFFTSQMMSDLSDPKVLMSTTFVNVALKLIRTQGPSNPWPISALNVLLGAHYWYAF